MIEEVAIREMAISSDERGFSYSVVSREDKLIDSFGDVHVSGSYPGVVKAWHRHESKDECIFCVRGMAKLVLYDGREGSSTRGELMEIFLGEHKPLLVRIPRGVHHGYKCVSEDEVFLVVISSEPFDPEKPDVSRLPSDTEVIPYDWEIRMG